MITRMREPCATGSEACQHAETAPTFSEPAAKATLPIVVRIGYHKPALKLIMCMRAQTIQRTPLVRRKVRQ